MSKQVYFTDKDKELIWQSKRFGRLRDFHLLLKLSGAYVNMGWV